MATKKKTASEKALGMCDVAPPRTMEEDPDGLLSKTSTTQDEQRALDAKTYELADLAELEERIGIASRIVLEHALRIPCRESGMTSKEKCDIALKAISTLEGTKQEVVWRERRMKKPTRVTVDALKKEKERVADRLMKVALRKKEVQLRQAEEALAHITEDDPEDEEIN